MTSFLLLCRAAAAAAVMAAGVLLGVHIHHIRVSRAFSASECFFLFVFSFSLEGAKGECVCVCAHSVLCTAAHPGSAAIVSITHCRFVICISSGG